MSGKLLLILLIILNIFLSGCGQSGDLILPPQEHDNQQSQKVVKHVS